jgi:cytidine deaminase
VTPTTDQPEAPQPVDAAAFDRLRAEAVRLAARAYAPYSGYPVGAAALVDDGRIVSGCNVENSGYGVTLCAECGLVSDLIAGGGGRLVAFTCVDADGRVITPCGRCRQLLSEHAAPGLLVETPEGGTITIEQLLPGAFGPAHLAAVEGAVRPADHRP